MGDSPYSYAIYRLVPRIDRGEQMNVGVLVFSRPAGYLAVRTALDEGRLRALWPDVEPAAIRPHLTALERIAAGEADAGPMARLDVTARFHWLTAPSSTVIQPSEIHTGVCGDPAAELERLFGSLVA